MAEHTTGDKGEKQEKHDEKERNEKFRNDPLSAMAWAAVLIWTGVVLLIENMRPEMWAGKEVWAIIAVGAGVIFLGEALIRILRPEYRKPIGGTLIFAVILIASGLGELFVWENIWPLALIAIGVGLLIGAFSRRR